MKIGFTDKEVELACNNYPDSENDLQKLLKKTPITPDAVMSALVDLRSADSPDDLPSLYHYHPLKYDLSGFAAIDVKAHGKGGRGVWRILLEPISECGDINNKKSITKVVIRELVYDYHKN